MQTKHVLEPKGIYQVDIHLKYKIMVGEEVYK